MTCSCYPALPMAYKLHINNLIDISSDQTPVKARLHNSHRWPSVLGLPIKFER